jgi:hypothetical protein
MRLTGILFYVKMAAMVAVYIAAESEKHQKV